MARPPQFSPETRPKSATESTAETAGDQRPIVSCQHVPRAILGRGYRWPGSARLERKVWAEIIRLEIGGSVSRNRL